MKFSYGILFGILFCGVLQSKNDPLAKIEIKSNRAFTTPLKKEPGMYLVKYDENVRVDLADKTHIDAESLEVIVSRKAMPKTEASDTKEQKKATIDEQVKSVVFKGNVKINRLNHLVKADRAELILAKKQCAAIGNVHIAQKRLGQNDIPVMIDSEKAILDLTSEKLLLVGTAKAPVSTVFQLKQAAQVK